MKITDVAGCVAWAVLLLLAALGIPLFGPLLSLLIPLPFLFYSTKLGLYPGLQLAALTGVTIGVAGKLAGYPQAALFCVEFSILGLTLSVLFRRRWTFARTVFWGTAVMVGVGLILLVAISVGRGMALTEMMRRYLEVQISGALVAYQGEGVPSDQTVTMEELGEGLVGLFIRIYPALMVLGSAFAVWLNVCAAKPLFRLRRLPYPDFPPLDRWKAPEYLVWGVIAAGFAVFLAGGALRLVAVNALIVLGAVYVFHGVSVVLFFLNKYRAPMWVRIGVCLVIVVQVLFLALLALVGLFDQWIDWRKIARRNETGDPGG